MALNLPFISAVEFIAEVRSRLAQGHTLLSSDMPCWGLGYYDETDDTQLVIALGHFKGTVGQLDPSIHNTLKTAQGRADFVRPGWTEMEMVDNTILELEDIGSEPDLDPIYNIVRDCWPIGDQYPRLKGPEDPRALIHVLIHLAKSSGKALEMVEPYDHGKDIYQNRNELKRQLAYSIISIIRAADLAQIPGDELIDVINHWAADQKKF